MYQRTRFTRIMILLSLAMNVRIRVYYVLAAIQSRDNMMLNSSDMYSEAKSEYDERQCPTTLATPKYVIVAREATQKLS